MHPPLRAGTFDCVWSAGQVLVHHRGAAAGVRQAGRALYYRRPPRGLALLGGAFLALSRNAPSAAVHASDAGACGGGALPVLALPLYLAGSFAPLFGRRRLPLGTVRFGLYDSLTPRYQSRHTEREVRDWFADNGFVQVRKWSELGLSGERRG